MSKQTINFTLPADMKHSSLVRRISQEVFEHVGFDSDWSDRLKLVMDELYMNAIKYGSHSEEAEVHIAFTFDDDEVVFMVEDEGGKRKTTARELREIIDKNICELEDATKTCGRGLALISNLWTDEMMIEKSSYGGLAISFRKKISNDKPPALPIIDENNHS